MKQLSKKALTSLILLAFSAGCAARPESIKPAYISPLQYSDKSCDQLRLELTRLQSRVVEVSGVQERTANKDAVAMGVGLVLFWPALFFIAGGDNRKEELARLKGEYDCIESICIEKNCSFTPELLEAKRKRQEMERQRVETMQKQQEKPQTEATNSLTLPAEPASLQSAQSTQPPVAPMTAPAQYTALPHAEHPKPALTSTSADTVKAERLATLDAWKKDRSITTYHYTEFKAWIANGEKHFDTLERYKNEYRITPEQYSKMKEWMSD